MKNKIFIIILISECMIFNKSYSKNYTKTIYKFKCFLSSDSNHLYSVFSANIDTFDYLFEYKNKKNKKIEVSKIKIFINQHFNSIGQVNNNIYVMCKNNTIVNVFKNSTNTINLPKKWNFNKFGFVKHNQTLYFLADSFTKIKLLKIENGNLIDCNIKEIQNLKINYFVLYKNKLIFLQETNKGGLRKIEYNLLDNHIYIYISFSSMELNFEENLENVKDSFSNIDIKFTIKQPFFNLRDDKLYVIITNENKENYYYSSSLNSNCCDFYKLLNNDFKFPILQFYSYENKIYYLQFNNLFYSILIFEKINYIKQFELKNISLNIVGYPIIFKNKFYYWDKNKKSINQIQIQ